MRNLLGGIIGGIVGSVYIWYAMQGPKLDWPAPYDTIGFLFEGSSILVLYSETGAIDLGIWFSGWAIAGIAIALFSTSKADSIRTMLWSGGCVFILLIVGVFILDPAYWNSTDRNLFLLIWLVRSVLTAPVALVSAIPLIVLRKKLVHEEETAPPEKIETSCVCGAIFKSKPLMCAECGRQMKQLSTLSTDASTQ